jgi:hypothetical protein
VPLLLVAVVGLIGALIVVRGTANGIGEGNDSSHYLSAADNLRHGKGFSVSFTSGFDPLPTQAALDRYGHVPVTHYPPGYPVALAAADMVVPGGLDAAARVVGALTIAALAFVAYALMRALGATPVLAAVASTVVALTPTVLHQAMWAMSDALAATLTLAALAVAARSRHRRTEWVAGALAAAAVLTRYGGFAAAAGAFALLYRPASPVRERLRTAARVIAPSVVAFVANLAVGAIRHGDGARPIAWHPPDSGDVHRLLDVLGLWSLGARHTPALRMAALALVIGLAVLARRTARAPEPEPRRVASALGVLVTTHIAVLAVTSALLDTEVTADRRLMLPAELAVAVFVAGRLAAERPRVAVAGVLALIVAGRLVAPNGPVPEGTAAPEPGPRGALYDAVAALPGDTVIVANAPEVLWRETRRASIVAPAAYEKLSGRWAQDFPERVAEMGRVAGARRAVLVVEVPRFLGVVVENPRVLSTDQVAQDLPCAQPLEELPEGVIYDLSPCASSNL